MLTNPLRIFFPILIFAMMMALGQVDSFGQYYPPQVSCIVNSQSSATELAGGGGGYSGGYYYNYYYDSTTAGGYWNYSGSGHYEGQNEGYWDISPGHYEEQGYWDYLTGYTDSEGNWVSQPTWISNNVWVPGSPIWVTGSVGVWVPDPPTWVDTTTTTTNMGTAYVSINLNINSAGDFTLSAYDDRLGTINNWAGSYSFSSGTFTSSGFSGGEVLTATNFGTPWSPPPPPPTYASFGPASVWVEGTSYSWTSTNFTDSSYTVGTDYYGDSSGHQVMIKSSADGTGSKLVEGDTPTGTHWTGVFGNGVFEVTSGIDVRAADSGGSYVQGTAPGNLPPAMRVDGSTVPWIFLGQGSTSYYYAGDSAHQRLTIDIATNGVTMQDDGSQGIYKDNAIWMSAGGRDVRAASQDGHLWQANGTPSWGPPDVYINLTLWRYVGTWDGTTTFPGTSPMTGDHYLGDNGGQRVVIDASGNVTVFDGSSAPKTGTYARQAQQEDAPRIFTVSGCDIYAGNEDSLYHSTQPAIGPPAIWVNETVYAFSSSNEDAAQTGNWVDTYVDGNNNLLLLRASGIRSFLKMETGYCLNWSGNYVPASNQPSDGGIFVVVTGSPRYDVRASSGITILPPKTTPLNGHPNVVKVDGVPWEFGGSTTDVDYYFGANPGERLWIDATGAVSFTNTVNSPNLAGTGKFLGSIFLVNGHDLRAHTSDPLPVNAVGSVQWGPAALWVEGVIWRHIGSVSDDSLQVHADFYGGPNSDEVVRVNSDMSVSGAYSGVFNGGVFVVIGGADLRALGSSGLQVPAVGSPANGNPTTLRIGGLHWNFIGTSDGVDYYTHALGGQRLKIDANGNVLYSNRPFHVNNATGTYAGGIFTSTSGGLTFNAGTIGNDLDILGNILSFGSLRDSSQTAGVTLHFIDDGNKATMFSALGRPDAQWTWNRSASPGSDVPLSVMKLDSSVGLTLQDPSNPTDSPIQLNPAAKSITINNSTVLTENSANDLYIRKDQIGGANNTILTEAAADNRYIRAEAPLIGDSPVLTQQEADQRYLRADQLTGTGNTGTTAILSQSSADARYLRIDQQQPSINNSPVLTEEGADTRYLPINLPTVNNSPVLTQESGDSRYLRSGQTMRVPQGGDIGMGEFTHGSQP